jgi:hypothetical protein
MKIGCQLTELERKHPDRLKFLRFQVEKLDSENCVIDDWGIWSGSSVLKALEPDDGWERPGSKVAQGFFDFQIGDCGKVIMGTGWSGERSTPVRITRLPGGTPIPDTRHLFDKILHFVFRVKWEQ